MSTKPTPAHIREVAIYALTDLIAEQTGRDGPDRPHHEDDLLREAEAAWEAEQRGEVKPETLMVIMANPVQLPGEPYHWTYQAVVPDEQLKGCVHHVHGSTAAMRRAAAVAEHRYVCLGERL